MKMISVALSITMLSFTTIYVTPAFAENASNAESSNSKPVPLVVQVQATNIPEDHVYIPAKTKLELENIRTIDSKTARTGDPVKFKTLSNLIINNVIVIPAGTVASGVITNAVSAGGLGRAGKLEFSIKSLNTLNNVEVPLVYDSTKSGQGDDGAVAVLAFVSILGGLFMKGTNVQCVEGTKVQAVVPKDTDLNITFDELADAMNPNKPHGVNIILRQ